MATNEELRSAGLASRAVHAGERQPRPEFTPTSSPIYPSTSYTYDDADKLGLIVGGEERGYVYSRTGNPTIKALEAAVASIEESEAALAVASGMAAVHLAVLHGVRAGSKIVAAHDLYGATTVLFTNIFTTLNVETVFVDMMDIAAVERTVMSVKPSVVVMETISNPLLRVPDLPAIATIAHAHGARLIVDNTFATPVMVTPLAHGADVVVHSSTKYFGGHGDVTGGVIATDAFTAAEIFDLIKLTGAVIGPFEAWLTLRGLKTLPLRIEKQSRNAAAVASWLANDPRVDRVHYPGLDDSVHGFGHFRSPLRGAMIAFEVPNGSHERSMAFLNALKMWVPGTSLGDIYSLAISPAAVTHRSVDPELRRSAGLGEGLIRLSVGIEDVEDLIVDLDQALATATNN